MVLARRRSPFRWRSYWDPTGKNASRDSVLATLLITLLRCARRWAWLRGSIIYAGSRRCWDDTRRISLTYSLGDGACSTSKLKPLSLAKLFGSDRKNASRVSVVVVQYQEDVCECNMKDPLLTVDVSEPDNDAGYFLWSRVRIAVEPELVVEFSMAEVGTNPLRPFPVMRCVVDDA